MPFDPRTAPQVLRSLAARLVARSGLTDLVKGSKILGLAGAFAEEIAGVELKIANVRDSFSLASASGSMLDERVQDLPSDFPSRRSQIPASGSVLSMTREDTAGALTVPAGAIVGRSDDSSLSYETRAPASFAAGVATVGAIPVVCLSPGSDGNCDVGQIDTVISVTEEIVSVSNTSALANGRNEETDDSLRNRAYLYLAGLAQCQPSALESFALNFQGSLGEVLTFARAFEDPSNPGYTELVVDDGSGMDGLKREGLTTTGTSGVNGTLTQIWHERAAVSTPLITIGGSPPAFGSYVSHPEKGLIWLDEPMAPSTTWSCTKYKVYTGILSELQAAISGRRAAGTRVRVVPPTVQRERFDLIVVPASGVDLDTAVNSAVSTVTTFTAGLGPGEPLYVSRLAAAILEDDQILNVTLREPDSTTHASDRYPTSDRYVLRTTATDIQPLVETTS
jgi:uncharacterized phage protein gp47/JayE